MRRVLAAVALLPVTYAASLAVVLFFCAFLLDPWSWRVVLVTAAWLAGGVVAFVGVACLATWGWLALMDGPEVKR